ncbi:YrdB family protein [Plantibacter sp. Mn2098]|uniref:YrdB family protein n=1 Tax=Plantibacter sp. Mn2098 TaxID=3395266 RepID=UPI003BD7AB41
MPEQAAATTVRPNDILRVFLLLVAFFTLGFWGFVAWPLPWNIVIGIGAPVLAILIWALFLSPKPVLQVDLYGRTLVELFLFGSAALAWWNLDLPIVAGAFALVAVASGVINGRKEIG